MARHHLQKGPRQKAGHAAAASAVALRRVLWRGARRSAHPCQSRSSSSSSSSTVSSSSSSFASMAVWIPLSPAYSSSSSDCESSTAVSKVGAGVLGMQEWSLVLGFLREETVCSLGFCSSRHAGAAAAMAHLQSFLERELARLTTTNLTQLRSQASLRVEQCGLRALPEIIGQFSACQSMHLTLNCLKALPTSIRSLVQCQSIDLSKNRISLFPSSILHLAPPVSALQELKMRCNLLTSLPLDIGRVSGLRNLDFACNKLIELPDDVGNLIHLQRLDVSENEIESLPCSIGQLTRLQFLSAASNRLKELPDSMGSLVALRRLHASFNQLAEIPDGIVQLESLRMVSLAGNPCTAGDTLSPNVAELLRESRQVAVEIGAR